MGGVGCLILAMPSGPLDRLSRRILALASAYSFGLGITYEFAASLSVDQVTIAVTAVYFAAAIISMILLFAEIRTRRKQ
jgi:hypothetical protein